MHTTAYSTGHKDIENQLLHRRSKASFTALHIKATREDHPMIRQDINSILHNIVSDGFVDIEYLPTEIDIVNPA
ncbi:hypothetical protein FB567DRAFT_593374 [Paraphoma chrysanthemicola]|uniref:Uncharacterized protein n=1 Tax=Paraphoma chrysanthemicola TaxID=798071 RepID=A0A8K0R3W4_9PLEO|nr:hypothetical protein FB567DRAFT_593374 [Paraphoma chrysanthemicola]